MTQEDPRGLVLCPSLIRSRAQLAKLHFAEGEEDVFLAGEIIEESAFAEVGGVGDVFDGGFGEAFAREKIESGAEKTLSAFDGLALAAIRGKGY